MGEERWGGAELGAGLFPNINTCVKTPGKSSPTHHPSTLLSAGVWRGGGAGVPGTGWLWGWLWSTASAGCVPHERPAAHCRSDDTRGPPGWWGLPGSASRCWDSHTSTPHAARSETSCTEERRGGSGERVPAATSFPLVTQPEVLLRWHRASSAGYDFSTLTVCRGILLKCRFPFSESGVGMANKLPCDTGAAGPRTTL